MAGEEISSCLASPLAFGKGEQDLCCKNTRSYVGKSFCCNYYVIITIITTIII